MHPELTGDIYFVQSGQGNAQSDGSSQRPINTIDNAFNISGLGVGDAIVVLPGHAEDISSGTSCVMDVAGVTVIGIGDGANIPTLTFTNTAGSVEIDAASIKVSGIKFLASVSAVVIGINIDAANITLEDCILDFDATGDDFITGIDIDAVNDVTLKNVTMIMEDAAGCDEGIRLDDCDNVTIEDCHLYGDFTLGCILGEGATGTNLLIKGCKLYNSDTSGGEVIDLNVAFTGLLIDNRCGTLFATAPETAFDPGSCLCIENYVVNAVDESGTIVPVTLST